MNHYAVMHCNAELHCYAVINVDKSTVSVSRQVNAFRCSSTHYDWLFGISIENTVRRMAENGFAPHPTREFRRHILSCKELKAESFKKCFHSVRWGFSL